MKILMLTPYLPYPLHSGGQTRSYNLIKNLSQKHEITLFSFIRNTDEEKYLPELTKYCKSVKVFLRRKAWSPINILLSGFTVYPFLVCIYLSTELKNAIARAIDTEKFDLIHAETFYVMPTIPVTHIPIILVEQTIEYAVYKHYVDHFRFRPLVPLLNIDVRKIKYWETYFWKKATRVIAVSASDQKEMLKLAPGLDIGIVPNGVDYPWLQTGKFVTTHPPTVLYVGNFKWLQNTEAVEVLVREVWPLIVKGIPNATLKIVGRGMDNRVRSLQNQSVVIDENVEDIRSAYQNADLTVVTLKGPGGTRLKILEAMASGVPIISTSVGVEGLNIIPGKHALVTNDFKKMANSAIALLKNKSQAKELSKNSQQFVKTHFSWDAISHQLEKIYGQAKKPTL